MTFFIYRDTVRQWRWRLVINGWVIANSGEGYRERSECLAAIEVVKGSAEAAVANL